MQSGSSGANSVPELLTKRRSGELERLGKEAAGLVSCRSRARQRAGCAWDKICHRSSHTAELPPKMDP